jgi:hypothetical protein
MTTGDARPQRRRLLLLGLAAALAIPAPRAALARAGRVRFQGVALPERGPYGAGAMTQADLERCVMLEREINSGADAIEAEGAAIGARKAKLGRQSRAVAGRAARADLDDEATVQRHNRSVQRQRSAANDFDARLPAFNARADRHEARVADFNAGCAGNRYHQDGMRTVRARLLLG